MPILENAPLGRPLLDKRNRASRVWLQYWTRENKALAETIAAEASARIQAIADEANARIAELAAHVAAVDPHVGYQKETEKEAVNGYAGLDPAGKLNGVRQVYGTAVNTACEGNDVRLSNARTPTAHVHSQADVTNLSSDLGTLTALLALINGPWLDWTPDLGSSVGNEAATFASSTLYIARYKLIGKTLIMQVRFAGTLNAVTPGYLTFTIPAGTLHNAESYGSAVVQNNGIYEAGIFRTAGADEIFMYRPNFASYTSGGDVEGLGLIVAEMA